MLLDFLEKPDEFYDHLRRYSSSLTAQMTYGFRVKNVNDPYIAKLFWVGEPSVFALGELSTLTNRKKKIDILSFLRISWVTGQYPFSVPKADFSLTYDIGSSTARHLSRVEAPT